MTNVITLAYSTGHKGDVVCGGRFDRELSKLDRKLDAVVSSLMSPELRALQSKVSTKSATKSEFTAHRKGLKALYAHPEYLRVKSERDHWIRDALHKVSHSVVQRCAARDIEVLVIGLNKGWKDGSDMGREKNRHFARLAHSRLLTLIRYKAEALGIVVVSNEESYTSKTSFINDVPLLSKENGTPRKAKPAGRESAATLRAAFGGTRPSKERNTFRNDTKSGRVELHADMNGAYNIIRKVFGSFRYHAKLCLSHTLLWLSPRRGIVPMQLKQRNLIPRVACGGFQLVIEQL